ncbi:MAG: hypothetical protein KDJ29_06200 [Hyphomicrobiales bacterium]|nr:hypothetical protein [Hyphomicrobiales bacterium]
MGEFLISPEKIELTLLQQNLNRYLGYSPKPGILPGDWDTIAVPFKGTPIFRGFEQHFKGGLPWRKTEYFDELEKGFLEVRVKRLGGYDQFFSHYDKLYEKMEKEGFDVESSKNSIVVNGGRNRSLIRHDGNHRLSIALLLNLPLVRARYNVVHPDHIAFTCVDQQQSDPRQPRDGN